MSQKRDKRLESKKRKAKAFLELAYSESNNQEPSNNEAKKIKLEQGGTEKPSEDTSAMVSAVKKETLTTDELLEYRKKLKEMQAASMQRPKIFLLMDELTRDYPMVSECDEIKQPPPLFIADVQTLILYALLVQTSSFKPRWCNLLRPRKISKVVVVVLDSVSSEEFQQYGDSLPTLKYAFDGNVEMIPPVEYDRTVRQDLMDVPITIGRWKKINKRRAEVKKPCQDSVLPVKGSVAGKKRSQDPVTPVKGSDLSVKSLPFPGVGYSEFDRTCLLMNTGQIIQEGVPIPVNIKKGLHKGFVFSKHTYGKVAGTSPMFAIDCEMIQTTESMMDLARVSIVNENLETIYDTFVKPSAKVKDYVTRYSGVTAKILAPVMTRLKDVQNHLRQVLPPDAILCGQSIGGDLRSLKMFHPYLIDTSVIFNLSGNRRMKTGLKRLTDHFLGRSIQDSSHGHSSVEDAQATMELVLLKLKQGPEFGDMSLPTFIPDESPGEESPVKSKLISPSEENIVQTDGQTHTNRDNMDTRTPAESCEQTCTSNCNCSHVPNTGNQGNDGELSNCDSVNSNCGSPKTECHQKHDRCSEVKHEVKTEAEEVDQNMRESCIDSSIRTSSQHSDSEDNDTKCQSDSEDPREENVKIPRDDAARRKLFFQSKGSKVTEAFLERIEEDKKKGVVIDEPDSAALYPDGMPLVQGNTDKARELATVSAQEGCDFTLTHLYGYRDFLRDRQLDTNDDEEKKKCLWKLDRRFWKILMGSAPKSLFVVILPGRQRGDTTLPARTFVKITSGMGDSETK